MSHNTAGIAAARQKVLEYEKLYQDFFEDSRSKWKPVVLESVIALLKESPNIKLEFTRNSLIESYKGDLKNSWSRIVNLPSFKTALCAMSKEGILKDVGFGRYRLTKPKSEGEESETDESESDTDSLEETEEKQTVSESEPIPCFGPENVNSSSNSQSKEIDRSTNESKKQVESSETAMERVLRYEAKYKDFYMRTTSHWKPPVLKYIFILLKEQPNLDLEFTRGELHKKYHLKIEIEADSKVTARGNSLSSCLKGMCYDGIIEHVGAKKSGCYRVVKVMSAQCKEQRIAKNNDSSTVENPRSSTSQEKQEESNSKPQHPVASSSSSSSSLSSSPSSSELSEDELLNQIHILMERHGALQRDANEAKAQAMILLQMSKQ